MIFSIKTSSCYEQLQFEAVLVSNAKKYDNVNLYLTKRLIMRQTIKML